MAMSSYGFLMMYSYEVITYLCGYTSGQNKQMTWDNMLAPFLIGGTSRLIASSILYPLSSVLTRIRMKQYSKEDMKERKLI